MKLKNIYDICTTCTGMWQRWPYCGGACSLFWASIVSLLVLLELSQRGLFFMMMRGGRSDFSDYFLWNKKNLKRDIGRWDWKIKTLRQKKAKKIVKIPKWKQPKKLEILQNMPHFYSDFIIQKHAPACEEGGLTVVVHAASFELQWCPYLCC